MIPPLRSTRAAVLLVAVLAARAEETAAQICMEMPITAAGFGVAVQGIRASAFAGEFEGEPGVPAAYGLAVRGAYDPVGPFALGVAFTRSSFEDGPDTATITARHYHGKLRAAYQLTAGGLEACPVVEVGLFAFDREGPDDRSLSATGLFASAGWTFEGSIDAGSLRIAPFVSPSLLMVRSPGRIDYYYGYDEHGSPEILLKLSARVGAYVSGGRAFAGVHWETVFPGSDPRFWLMGATADDRAANSLALTVGIGF